MQEGNLAVIFAQDHNGCVHKLIALHLVKTALALVAVFCL